MIKLVAFVWVGIVLGVSFLATPIKFQADSLTLPVALDVGRATFHALQKVEWAFAALITIGVIRAQAGDGGGIQPVDGALLAIVFAILIAQAVWLIPQLDVRVAAIIDGETLERSHLHTVFAGLEGVKVVALAFIGAWTAGHVGV